MADDSDGENSLAEQNLENARQVAAAKTCDKSYTTEYKRFVKFVKEELDIVEPPFITPRTVDEYFTRTIPGRKGGKEHMSRIPNALMFYYNYRENVIRIEKQRAGHPVELLNGKIKDRPRVKNALEAQESLYEPEGNGDPHKGLKDILTTDKIERAMNFIYGDGAWGELAIHFLYGQNGAIRGASNRNLRYCDLRYSDRFVHEADQGALLIILRRGKSNKDRHDRDRQVAYWRHRDYRVCSIFATAAYLIWNLARDNDINFYHADKNQQAAWWDKDFTNWNNYNCKLNNYEMCS